MVQTHAGWLVPDGVTAAGKDEAAFTKLAPANGAVLHWAQQLREVFEICHWRTSKMVEYGDRLMSSQCHMHAELMMEM